MPLRGIRGATVVDEDRPDLIRAATRELLETLASVSLIDPADIASIIFTTTPDLTTEYPARAARDLGWSNLPALGATEMAMPDGLPRCICVHLHVNTDRPADSLRQVYLGAAKALRPDR